MRPPIPVTPYSLALRYLGMREMPGAEQHHPQIVAWLHAAGLPSQGDETPWCSAFAYHVAWELDLRRPATRLARARSWLSVGLPIEEDKAVRGFHVVVLSRGGGQQPGPHVLDAPGHVGFFDGYEEPGRVRILGGNQGDAVTIVPYPRARILGIREI